MRATQEGPKRADDAVLPPKQTLTMVEACAMLGIHESTGYRLAAAGKFPVRVLEVGWSKKVSRAELERYLNGGQVAS